MRVVYDTSVLVTIISRRDLIILLQADIALGKVTVVTSEYILDELERVLNRKLGMTRQQARTRVNLVARIADVVTPDDTLPAVSHDTTGDPVLATAQAGHAELLVTLDKDLLILEQYGEARIVDFYELSDILGSLD